MGLILLLGANYIGRDFSFFKKALFYIDVLNSKEKVIEFKKNHKILRTLCAPLEEFPYLFLSGTTTLLAPLFFGLKASLWNLGKLIFKKDYTLRQYGKEVLSDLRMMIVSLPFFLGMTTLINGTLLILGTVLVIPRLLSLLGKGEDRFTSRFDAACAFLLFQEHKMGVTRDDLYIDLNFYDESWSSESLLEI